MIDKYICIKEVILIDSNNKQENDSYKEFFKINSVYEFEKEGETFPYTHLNRREDGFFKPYHLRENEFNEYFISLNVLREQKITKILEDD